MKESCSDGLNGHWSGRVVVGGDSGLRFPRHCHCLLLLEYRDKDGYRENFTSNLNLGFC